MMYVMDFKEKYIKIFLEDLMRISIVIKREM